MKLKLVIGLLVLAFGQSIFAQTKAEIEEMGDNAYKNENYASAVYFLSLIHI